VGEKLFSNSGHGLARRNRLGGEERMGKPKWFTAWLCAFFLHLAASSFSITGVQVSLERAPSVFAGMLNGLLLNWSHPWEQPLDIAQLDATIQDTPDNPLQTKFQHDITTYGKHFIARVAHLVFNALQLMLARPELVQWVHWSSKSTTKRSPSRRLGPPT
jgi:hypothetical protein